jgi:hypothetical protein
MRLRDQLKGFRDPVSDAIGWPNTRNQRAGLQRSKPLLRNVGFKGYGILDKHIIRCLAELGVLDSAKPPATRARYLASEV